MAQINPDDVRKREEFDYHLRAARVHRTRGDYDAAEQSVSRALELVPDNVEAREFAADILFARGRLEQAAEAYKAIFEADPSQVSAEEKYATALVQIAEGRRQQDLLKEMMENPSKFRLPPRNPVVAAVLSGIPGLGHVYCNQLVKGLVLFVATVGSWLLFYALAPPPIDPSNFGPGMQPALDSGSRIADFARNLSAPAVLFMCLAVFSHVYALVDAAVTASKMAEEGSPAKLAEPQ